MIQDYIDIFIRKMMNTKKNKGEKEKEKDIGFIDKISMKVIDNL